MATSFDPATRAASANGTRAGDWPRLLVVSEVPVANTFAGSLLMYRLLSNYPADRLWIFESPLGVSYEPTRLPGVRYSNYPGGKERHLRWRFAPWFAGWYLLNARRRAGVIVADVGDWPAAVLTVGHRFGWATAAAVADRLKVPLHLIIHDEPVVTMGLPPSLRAIGDRAFGRVYRRAASRLCVTPFMATEYQRRYGPAAEVLYPARGPATPVFDGVPPHLSEVGRPLVFAYGGSTASPTYVEALSLLADVLEPTGHRLVIYTHISPETVVKHRLDRSHVTVQSMLSPESYLHRLRETADALFVPMSFDPAERTATETAFPSKLTDYTAAGLPLLIRGPEYSSAVRWARDNPGVAVVAEGPSAEALSTAVGRITTDPAERVRLGETAVRVGARYFSPATAAAVLSRAVGTGGGDGMMFGRI